MRDPKRIFALLMKVSTYWHMYPDMRFWQFMLFLEARLKRVSGLEDIFHLEDASLMGYLDRLIEEG